MRCAHCGEEIFNRPVKQGDEHYCSLECANRATGWEQEEPDGYYDEADLEGLYEEEDE